MTWSTWNDRCFHLTSEASRRSDTNCWWGIRITGITGMLQLSNESNQQLHIHYNCHASLLSYSAIKGNSRKSNRLVSHLAILSLHDIVSSLSPCNTPSHVWIVVVERTGIVPSPDSIFVRSCPLALRFGCLSPWSKWQKLLTINQETFSKYFTCSINEKSIKVIWLHSCCLHNNFYLSLHFSYSNKHCVF